MRITAPLAALLFFALTLPAIAQTKKIANNDKPNIIPLDQIHAGMKGTALTVFQGVKPESMDVEVLGVMRNVNGPKGDIILVRLHGTKPEYTGVVAGMSGSPVYFDGKLAGALAFRIGEFSKEPIAGVTPIEEMLEINALDQSPARQRQSHARKRDSQPAGPRRPRAPAQDTIALQARQSYSNYLKPIDAPFVFNGFSDATLARYADQFAAAGIMPVMGIGSASDEKQPEPIEPGSAVSAVLVRGDMDIAATCTVTYVDRAALARLRTSTFAVWRSGYADDQGQGGGHAAFAAECFQDRQHHRDRGRVRAGPPELAFMGVPGREPKMIPVTVAHAHTGARNHDQRIPLRSSQQRAAQPLGHDGHRLQRAARHQRIRRGHHLPHEWCAQRQGVPDVTMRNMFAPQDNGQPAAALAAASIGDRFGRIYSNPYDAPDVEGVKLDFDLVRERRSARLEASRTDMTEARPGDTDHGRDRDSSLSRRAPGAPDSHSHSDLGFKRDRCAFWSATATHSTACIAPRP